jgi:mycothiol synthase
MRRQYCLIQDAAYECTDMMLDPRNPSRLVEERGLPHADGVLFRRFKGPSELPAMAEVMNRSWAADRADLARGAGELEREFSHSPHFDPALDLVMVEAEGALVGWTRIGWRQMKDDLRIYYHSVHLLPEWRRMDLRRTMLKLCENRLSEVAREHPAGQKKCFESWAWEGPNDWGDLLVAEGYAPSWHVLEMLREDLDHIPDLPLPEGVEVRPVQPEHIRKIWDATREAIMDENSFSYENWGEEAFERYKASPRFQPHLWQVAWDGDEVVGGVHVFVDEAENREKSRKWGHTEEVTVRRPWRGRGVAKALLTRSLRVLREHGMEAATLDVDSDNPSGALKLYESLGFRAVRQFTIYRRPF